MGNRGGNKSIIVHLFRLAKTAFYTILQKCRTRRNRVMALSIDEKKAIIAYRIQKASTVLVEAKDNARLEHWNLVANRLYYECSTWLQLY